MRTSQKGIELIHGFEACEKRRPDGLIEVYIDAVGVPTIGWGSTFYPDGSKVKQGDPPITQHGADEIFESALKQFESAVGNLVKKDLTQNQFEALVSLCYNIGVGNFGDSTALRRINNDPNDPTIREAICRWTKGTINGTLRDLPGLVARRKKEADFYFGV